MSTALRPAKNGQEAAIISTTLRQYDTFGRYGGEEFLMVLEGVNKEHLAALAERTRAAVETTLNQQVGLTNPITISLGGTLVTSADQSIDDVIKRADEALYLAKNQGRNRVVLLIDEPDEKPEKGSAQAEAPSA